MSFNPDIPPDLGHAPLIREEALEWLERQHAGMLSFSTSDVLHMGGEPGRRWLVARLRAHGIGDKAKFSLPDTADALTVLFLRSKGVKFRDAVDAVVDRKEPSTGPEPRYGGVWNRLIIVAMDRLRRLIPPRLLAGAVFLLLPDPKDHPNCLVIVKRHGKQPEARSPGKAKRARHDYVYQRVLERPAPSCAVIAPSLEVLFFATDQLPARSEVTSRHFFSLRVTTEFDSYELLVGTMRSLSKLPDSGTSQFVGRILDIVFLHFEDFLLAQSSSRLETAVEPESASADDLQLWLTVQFLASLYPRSLCEISETSAATHVTKVLASSVARPWKPTPWEPAKSLEMLSGYASMTGVPLVVEKVQYPWTLVVEGKSRAADGTSPEAFSALAIPITLSSGSRMASLYMLIGQIEKPNLDVEVRILSVFSRIIGEMTERHRAATYSAETTANTVSPSILKQEQFQVALLDLLTRKAEELHDDEPIGRDVRLPFLLLATHGPEPDQFGTAVSRRLKDWLVETMRHLEWRSFVRSHWPGAREYSSPQGFIGEVPRIGMMIALGDLVSKDDLDRIRSVFPTTINQTSPPSSPVKLVAWILDVPAERILDAAKHRELPGLAEEIEGWAFDVATVVDDIAQSSVLAHEKGEWEVALKRIRQALRKQGARQNSYLRRLAADCSLALGDWPSALKYARDAVKLSGHELGSGLVRSLCLEADARLCLCDPVRSWDLYSDAASKKPSHPLPRYYRGQALLLMARLLRVDEDERRRTASLDADQEEQIDTVVNALVDGAIEDLTSAADLLERWGLIPESYQYRNFHLVPTLIAQGLGYLLARSPGPAASRLQSARRSFPKDDLFFREFLFAKCWEQGVHRRYSALLLSDGWEPLRARLDEAFG